MREFDKYYQWGVPSLNEQVSTTVLVITIMNTFFDIRQRVDKKLFGQPYCHFLEIFVKFSGTETLNFTKPFNRSFYSFKSIHNFWSNIQSFKLRKKLVSEVEKFIEMNSIPSQVQYILLSKRKWTFSYLIT